MNTIEVRIEQGTVQGHGQVSLAGYWALREAKNAQTDYLMASYVKGARPVYPPGYMGSRTKDSLRRIGVMAREQGRGIPAIEGVLFAAGDWKACVGGVMVRYRAGVAGCASIPYVPIIVDSELVGRLDGKRILYVREACAEATPEPN